MSEPPSYLYHEKFRSKLHVLQISGLNLTTDEENLAVLYLATIQALAVRDRI